jgi:hypothetical protein
MDISKAHAKKIMEAHEKMPFEYDGTKLSLDYAETIRDPNSSDTTVLYITGFEGGEQMLKSMVSSWGDAVKSVRAGVFSLNLSYLTTNDASVKSLVTGNLIGFVNFKHLDDRIAAQKKLPALYGVKAWPSRAPQDEDGSYNPPSDTLCVIGFEGSKSELRQYFHDFRDKIISVRIREHHFLFTS